MKHNFHHSTELVTSLAGQFSAATDGPEIRVPQSRAQQFVVTAAFGATAPNGTKVVVQWKNSAGTWATLKAHDKTTDLEIVSAGVNTRQMGTLELARLPADAQAIRLRVEPNGATDVGVMGFYYMLGERSAGQVDAWWGAQRSA